MSAGLASCPVLSPSQREQLIQTPVEPAGEEPSTIQLERSRFLAEYALHRPASAGHKPTALRKLAAAHAGHDSGSEPDDPWVLDGWGDDPSPDKVLRASTKLSTKWARNMPCTLPAANSPFRRVVSAGPYRLSPQPLDNTRGHRSRRAGGAAGSESTSTRQHAHAGSQRAAGRRGAAGGREGQRRLNTIQDLEVGDESDIETEGVEGNYRPLLQGNTDGGRGVATDPGVSSGFPAQGTGEELSASGSLKLRQQGAVLAAGSSNLAGGAFSESDSGTDAAAFLSSKPPPPAPLGAARAKCLAANVPASAAAMAAQSAAQAAAAAVQAAAVGGALDATIAARDALKARLQQDLETLAVRRNATLARMGQAPPPPTLPSSLAAAGTVPQQAAVTAAGHAGTGRSSSTGDAAGATTYSTGQSPMYSRRTGSGLSGLSSGNLGAGVSPQPAQQQQQLDVQGPGIQVPVGLGVSGLSWGNSGAGGATLSLSASPVPGAGAGIGAAGHGAGRRARAPPRPKPPDFLQQAGDISAWDTGEPTATGGPPNTPAAPPGLGMAGSSSHGNSSGLGGGPSVSGAGRLPLHAAPQTKRTGSGLSAASVSAAVSAAATPMQQVYPGQAGSVTQPLVRAASPMQGGSASPVLARQRSTGAAAGQQQQQADQASVAASIMAGHLALIGTGVGSNLGTGMARPTAASQQEAGVGTQSRVQQLSSVGSGRLSSLGSGSSSPLLNKAAAAPADRGGSPVPSNMAASSSRSGLGRVGSLKESGPLADTLDLAMRHGMQGPAQQSSVR